MIHKMSEKQVLVETWWHPSSPVSDKDWIAVEGSIRSGKTFAVVDSFINWSLTQFDRGHFIIAGAAYGSLRRNVIAPMFDLLDMKGINYTMKWDRGELIIGDHRYYFFGAWNDMAQNSLQGMTASGFFADEAAILPRSFIEQAMGRCSVEGSKYWFTLNPQGPNHWFKTDILDKADEMNGLRLRFTLHDNPSLSKTIINKYERMFSGVFYDRFILGKWSAAEGLVYDMFDPKTHIIAASKRIRDYSYFVVGIDYGISTTTAMGLYGINFSKNRITMLDERYYTPSKEMDNMTDDDALDMYYSMTKNYPIKAVYIDPSANSLRNLLRRSGEKNVRRAKNDILQGINHVAAKFKNNELYIDYTCLNTIDEIQSYVWDVKMVENGVDKPVKRKDHAMDQLRYVIHSNFTQPAHALERKPEGY